MKKRILSVFILASLITLCGCNNNSENSGSLYSQNDISSEVDTRPQTNYEIVKEFMDDFVIENPESIVSNIYLPKKISEEGVITWKSSDPKVINSDGHVTRSIEKDIPITLTAIAVLGSTREKREYDVVVKKIEGTIEPKVVEAMNDFILWPDEKINRDIIVLPRVTNINGVYISWETSDSSIIDLDGNVYRSKEEKTVSLTGTFSLGDVSLTKSFEVVVDSIKSDDYEYINENDPRILNKIYVSSLVEIVSAINEIKPGDAIILEDGIYRDVVFNILTSGTETNPIFIFAKNPGNVKLCGESRIDVIADYVIIANFNFVDGYPSKDTGVVALNGNHLRFTNNIIKNYELVGNDYKWLSLTGRYHEIDRNIFDGKTTGGSLLTVWRNDMSSQNHYIHKNQFLNYKEAGGANGYETIRIGTSTYSQSDSNIIVEDNLFENINGEIEIISIKAGRTIVRNNTFYSCIGLVTCRHGKNNLIEGNSFFCNKITDAGGIRMYDAGHVIRNNYIQDVNTSSNTRAGIVIHSGVNEHGETTVMNLQWTPFNILIKNNTIVNSRQSFLIGGKYAVACKDVTFNNNLVVSSDYAAIRYDKEPINPEFINNHFYALNYLDSLSVFKNVVTPSWFSNIIPELTEENGIYKYQDYGASNIVIKTKENTGTNF